MPVVWRLVDGKAGHERQTAGFIKALSKITPCDTYEIKTTGFGVCRSLFSRALPKLPAAQPDLIIGAGSKCQWPMLLLKHRFGGQTVYFMRPGLPSRLFDLCVVPRHDTPPRNLGSSSARAF
ncbi:MAG: ELM1/GtrOC1 family putative glycosyltransferase [Gammaproteobacteria bacterium]